MDKYEQSFSKNEASSSNSVPISKSKYAGTLVRIDKFNDSRHLCKVVRANDGLPLEQDVEVVGDIKQNLAYEKKAAKTIKTINTPDGPIMEVTDNFSSIRGSASNGFMSYNDFGNFIKGPLSITAAPHEVRMGGVMTMNPLLTSCFPSTIVTPVPHFVWNLPGAGSLATIAKDVVIMGTLVAAMGVG